MTRFLHRLLHEENGASAIEYGLIAGLVAVVLIGVLTLTGTSLQNVFDLVAQELQTVSSEGGGS